MISYSQNFEDVILDRVFRGQSRGFYVDVGAWHPVLDSVTAHFYATGWSGINVEPEPVFFSQLAEARPRDVNLAVALGDEYGERMLYRASGRSSFVREYAERGLEPGTEAVPIPVRVTTLAAVCEEHAHEPIDFLKIDVEGAERDVIAGGDWVRFRPRVVLVEATVPDTVEPCHESFEPLLLAANYVCVYFDGLNRFYVRREERELEVHFRTPPNVFDDVVLAPTHRLRQGAPDSFDVRARFDSLHAKIDWLHGECASRDSRVRSLASELESLEKDRAALARQRDEQQAEIDRLHGECAARDEAIRSLASELESLEKDRAALARQRDEQQAEIDRLHGECAARDEAIRSLASELESLEKDRAALARERDEQRAEIDRLHGECARRDELIERILASRSWRLTAPLRRLSRLVSRRGGGPFDARDA